MAHLLVVKGFQPGQRLPLPADKVFLGRDPTCGVILPDNTVSRKHALISRVQGKYFLEDGDGQGHKSRNGILLNNQPVPFPGRVLLKDQDRITINDFEWSFHEGPGPQQKLPDTVRFKGSEPGEERTPPPAVEASISLRGSSLLLQAQPAEKLQVLLEISNSLSKTLELEPLLPRILDSLFQLFKQADRGFLILHDEANHQLVPKVVRTRRPQEEGNARFSRSIVQQCLDKVQALLSTDATTDERFGQKNESILGALIRSVMCAPLWSQDGKAFGVIQLDTQDPRKKFTEEDLKLLMGVASQASIALANARLYQDSLARERLNRELELAREVQRSFLPLHLPKVPGYEFFARYESAEEVGGDYYDFLSLPGSRLGVLLGDVAGKGVPAALVMVKFSAEARTCLLTEPELAAAITRLNTNLSRTGLAERFVTLAAL
ncbi:MAG: GAF domain-containing protein, partial [Planctomycetes bacterium]|nr:GAF domain-containing protein [Planctomycetota bacterium]